MGNCFRREAGMHWAGDDWGSLVPATHLSGDTTSEKSYRKAADIEKEGFLVPNGKKTADKRIAAVMKIKIPKKQLEELLGRMGSVKGLAVEEVAAMLMRAGRGDQFETQKRSWKPALRSIQEVN